MKSKFIAGLVAAFLLGIAVTPTLASAGVVYLSTTTTVSGTGSVSCPSGTKLTGGGVGSLPSDSFSSNYSKEYQLTGSYPSGNGWQATSTLTSGTYYSNTGWSFRTSSYSVKVYAVCIK